ncbi:MAG: AAA domain-containing protein [Proteobacteria bacterium]|nr:AAA domain-containing protein [Pseudomonadota bacterium]NIS71726.1 AAA domain-containing protein [Pseudomonadota bacterium]
MEFIDHKRVRIEDVEITLGQPTELNIHWVGQEEVIKQLLAAWMTIDDKDLPFNPRVLGKPGVGKTTLAYTAARRLKKSVYMFQATMDTRPEDLIITPVVMPGGTISYAASSLVTAMIKGEACILDEGNRMSEKSWASLAPLLDDRRYVESVVAGIKIPAQKGFRIAVTMNDDASTYEIPEYIHSRLQPQIMIDFPEKDEEKMILRENLPFLDDEILEYVVVFLQRAHENDEMYTVRDGINIARYAAKLIKSEELSVSQALRDAVSMTLGEEVLQYL